MVEEVRKFRAQERYAQDIVDYFFTQAEMYLTSGKAEKTDEGICYHGSLHQMVKRILPSAQAADVVSILQESGAVRNIAHGYWEFLRREVFYDEEGKPISFDAPSFGHDSQRIIRERSMNALHDRITVLERKYDVLEQAVVAMAEQFGLVTNPEEEDVRVDSSRANGQSQEEESQERYTDEDAVVAES